MIFLSFGTVSDIDDKQQLASIAYFFLSKAIEKNGNDVNLYKNRILLMMLNDEAFGYTVSSAINPGGGFDIFSMNLRPFESRDAMYKMEYADLLKSPRLLSVDMLNQRYSDLNNKISNGFFGQNQTNQTIIEKGLELHKKVLDYLNNKVLTEENLDF